MTIKTPDLPTKQFESVKKFEAWLLKNHETSDGIWLKIFKKDSGIKTITYSEAVDVALCFGWIDAQKQGLDEVTWLQKFGPRKAKSIWSKINTSRVRRLIREGRMRPPGLAAVKKAKEDGRWGKAYDSPSKMIIPGDFLEKLRKDKKASAFFKTLNKTNLFSIGFRLQTAKKESTREKRMKEIIAMLANGKKFH